MSSLSQRAFQCSKNRNTIISRLWSSIEMQYVSRLTRPQQPFSHCPILFILPSLLRSDFKYVSRWQKYMAFMGNNWYLNVATGIDIKHIIQFRGENMPYPKPLLSCCAFWRQGLFCTFVPRVNVLRTRLMCERCRKTWTCFVQLYCICWCFFKHNQYLNPGVVGK